MDESEPARVQEQPAHAPLFQPAVELEIAVLAVAEHRVARVSEVDADLVGATCQRPDPGHGPYPVFAHRDPALALGVDILVERLAQLARAALPGAPHYGEVDLFHLPLAQHPVK